MERLEVSGAVRPIYGSLGVKRIMAYRGGGVELVLVRTCYCARTTVLHLQRHSRDVYIAGAELEQ